MILKKLGLNVDYVKDLIAMFDLDHPVGLMSAVSRLKETLNITEKEAMNIVQRIISG